MGIPFYAVVILALILIQVPLHQPVTSSIEVGLTPRLVVDFSHANCQKEHRKQLEVAKDICQQIESGSTYIAGIMAESFIEEGNQPMNDLNALTYGKSITDPCLSWQDTVTMLDMLANAIKNQIKKTSEMN